tara:strand:- start:481 stop:795 length:315 start_codon:yes stop_codon:yes gene_type:complete
MPLPSVHIVCGFAGGDGQEADKAPLFKQPQWSEMPSAGVVTTNQAADEGGLTPVFRITNTVDIICAHGPAPDVNTSPTFLLLAEHAPHDLYVTVRDKFVWSLAS